MSRWLCSVWLNILVQVASSVLAFSTVRCTVPMFALAFSKLDVTPSITRLTSLTRSSSACSRASRVSDCERVRVFAPEVDGLAKRSSVSSSRFKPAIPRVSVAFDMASRMAWLAAFANVNVAIATSYLRFQASALPAPASSHGISTQRPII
ncbi:hypothetical protein KC335_g47 [Hortaea werneckii]|nr:hypothetical protein KC335_g47 [Hortaea werneckii]